MKLSRVERWQLSNQLEILSLLDPARASHYREAQQAINEGFEGDYDYYCSHISENVVTEDEASEIIHILAMFQQLNYAAESYGDKSPVTPAEIRFDGFDGNSEGKQMMYLRFLHQQERFVEIQGHDGENSHFPTLYRYRRMLAEYDKSADPHKLTADDLARISASRRG